MKTTPSSMELENTLPTSRETFHPFSDSSVSPQFETFPQSPATPHFDSFQENPITPELKNIDGARIVDLRRESNYSIQSDDASSGHFKCFRTPSVVVSDHSEDTGLVALDEIRRIHGVIHRRSRRSRRHSDVAHDSVRLFSDSENVTDSSTNSDATEYYKGSNNASPVPRRKHRVCRATRKAISLDETAILRRTINPERKCSQASESSNDLSPISSRRSSLFSDDSSRRSSTFSDISPVLNRRTCHTWRKNCDNGNISPVFGVCLMDEFGLLESQRSFSFEDVYTNSDLSFSDLSSDCSASSSLSNLPGTLYYSSYNPNHYTGTSKHEFRPNGNIKPSKSCSDFLSVSRILEDYPYLRHRRHSNGQVAADISEFRSQKKNDEHFRKGKAVHGSLGKLNEVACEDVLEDKSISSENLSLRINRYFREHIEPEQHPEACRKVNQRLNDIGKEKDRLPVDDTSDLQHSSLSRKPSDCSTCSTLSGDNEVVQTLPSVKTRDKPSGWRKLRNIVQWTPFFQTYKKQRYPWVQLAGHQGNFKAGPEQGTILKKLCPKEEKCYKILMKDLLRPYVPEYKGQVTCEESECVYLQLQDLLVDFTSPCVLDCKLGVRTYLEEELAKAKEKPKLRKDMYEKMIQIDPGAPTPEEHRLRAVTKPRYMVWRETISSTSTLGFRLEGVRKSDGKSSKDFKTTKTKEQVKAAFRDFTHGFPHALPKYIQRLKAIKVTLEMSIFFSRHEVIGSSLLFVHDHTKANVWLIDFAKTLVLPDKVFIDHKSNWEVGNHEDGYLIGITNLVEIFSEIFEEDRLKSTPDDETTIGSDSTSSNIS